MYTRYTESSEFTFSTASLSFANNVKFCAAALYRQTCKSIIIVWVVKVACPINNKIVHLPQIQSCNCLLLLAGKGVKRCCHYRVEKCTAYQRSTYYWPQNLVSQVFRAHLNHSQIHLRNYIRTNFSLCIDQQQHG